MMSGLELGRFLARTVLLVKLASILGVSVDWLLGLSDTPGPATGDGASEIAAQLSPSNREWWLGLGKALAVEERVMHTNVKRWRKEV
jgi:hypothetical protein